MSLLHRLAPLAYVAGLASLAGLAGACSDEPDEVVPEDDLDGGKADGVSTSCFAAHADQLPQVSPGGARAVGGFRVTVGADARLEVRHAALAARPVFASATGAAFEAARATLDAPDRQGSFELIEKTQVACRHPKVATLRAGQGVVAARGGFEDADAACRGLTWELQLCQPRAGHLAFRLTTSDPSFDQLTLRAASDAGEKIFGMGEQFARDTLDLKGRAIPVIAQEGGVGRGHAPISPAVNAVSPGSAGSEASTYYAAPHFLTTRLRSLFLENSEPSVFDFTAPDAIAIRLHASTMSGRVLAGASPLELIERFTEYAGRMPAPPRWANEGAIVALASDPATSLRRIDALRAHGAVLSGIWNQTWSGKVTTYIGEQVLWNWVPSSTWRAYADQLAARGLRSLCYVNPMLVDPPASAGPVARNLFREAKAAGYLVTNARGEPYLQKITAFEVGLVDLSNPAARAWFKKVIKDEVLGRGRCSGWMADFAEALPFDAHLASGATGADWHNQYPVQWMRVNREAITEAGRLGDVLTFNRSGYTRTPAYSLMLWEGDQLTTWDKYDGLVSALHGLVNAGYSGIALAHSDTGGYTSLSAAGLVGYEREAELMKRWTEMNAFTALLRTHEGNQPAVNAQVYSDDAALDHFARFTKVFAALAFYRAQLFAEARLHGWPVVRALWMEHPNDATSATIDDEFQLGRDFLIAPVKNKCWTWPVCPYDKDVYLPPGRWVHLWSGATYGEAGAGSHVSVKAPIGEPAVFYRAGSTVAAQFITNLRAAGIQVADAR